MMAATTPILLISGINVEELSLTSSTCVVLGSTFFDSEATGGSTGICTVCGEIILTGVFFCLRTFLDFCAI